jgi:3-hydroxyacyl-[acyl-carrier-protein] dehydratase
MHAEPELTGQNPGSGPRASDLLALLPYKPGFLFIDEFLEADRAHTVAKYRFRPDEFFYAGHFFDRPITPGVILLEAMCQGGMVAQGLYLLAHEIGCVAASRYRFLVTNSEVEWLEQVRPDDTVVIRSQLSAWRQRRIRTDVKMYCEQGSMLATASISGMGVLWAADASPRDRPAETKENQILENSGGER